ncbi:hypothetical protein ACFIUX_07735 [Oenococcus oeni]|uniref:Uncharacterized protein n=1 Tax=Oenococcus phage phiS11 TaxID=1432847 RepID=V5URQ0_9CAUD|nr:hypothetical protein [Oenococcus oeni]YP_009006589.1 hypothetical protein CF81_gp13 [Oenococcus phage phiS11]AHB80348.1 hypothetical protein [Oenococcus phage phiS11]KGH52767.1 hypothetical protein X325_05750 [Oenococcus oeni S11]OIM37041.1 hypothetical protein ATX68_12945 [Oenococcus oeni]OLQ42062.1 hypothetical protein ATX63_09515 [Oenococcus oeni]
MTPEKLTFRLIQLVDDSAIYPLTEESGDVIQYIKNDKHWVESSINGSGHLPPDFYNNELKMMIDVMEVDDNAFKQGKKNPERQTEAISRKKLEKTGILKKFPNVEKIFVLPDTSYLTTSQHHSYTRYCHNFQRVIKKHNQSIKNIYLKNHPGFKTIFMVEDSSTMYMELVKKMNSQPKKGVLIQGKPHIPIVDRRLMEQIINSDIDFLVWHFSARPGDIVLTSKENVDFPTIFVIDIAKIDTDILVDYDESRMVSSEE